MTAHETEVGAGITPAPVHLAVVPAVEAPAPSDPALAQEVKNLVRGELENFLTDVEFRLAQSRAVEARVLAALEVIAGKGSAADLVTGTGQVYAEDLNIQKHQLTGYTVTSNSPSGGSIAWTSVNIVYNGTNYAITNGNSALKYVWFDAAVSTTVLQTNNTKPTLSGNACLRSINNGGTVQEVINASIPPVVANGAIDTAAIQTGAVGTTQIANGAVTPTQTSFYTTLANAVTAAQTAADLAQATADGSITTHFQATAPWAEGSVQPAAKTGDVWYDSDDGQAYRWSGPAGSPTINSWTPISDSDIGAALTAANNAQTTANSKITTFYAVHASTPTALAIGDLWVVTDRDNLIRRASATGTGSWVDLLVGTQAIANTAITTAKIANQAVTSTQIGNSAVTATQLGSGAVTPVKLNTLQHVLY